MVLMPRRGHATGKRVSCGSGPSNGWRAWLGWTPCRTLAPFPAKATTTGGWKATWSGLRARRHAPSTTCSWRRRGSPACAGDLIRLGAGWGPRFGVSGPLFTGVRGRVILGSSKEPLGSSSHSALAFIRRLKRRGRGRWATPGLPVEDDQSDRHSQPHAHVDPARCLDISFDIVRHADQEHATAGVIEEPHVPERHSHRRHQTSHQDGWLQAALFQEEEWQVPAGYERCQDHGGNKRRVIGLQTGLGEALPARMLTQRPVRWVDHTHCEHQQEGSQGAEGQRREVCPGRDIKPRVDQVDPKRNSYGQRPPDPPHSPADHPEAELAQSRKALGEGYHDEGGDERRERTERPERDEPPSDRVGQDEERDDRVTSDGGQLALSSLPP